ncbi:C40 family peptidase [Nonomuraea jabiensis]|uniref:C40 family peptidase n=1 Tax=Nonomuraea jabiensis TaxID=882448 RepID=UPI003D742ABA
MRHSTSSSRGSNCHERGRKTFKVCTISLQVWRSTRRRRSGRADLAWANSGGRRPGTGRIDRHRKPTNWSRSSTRPARRSRAPRRNTPRSMTNSPARTSGPTSCAATSSRPRSTTTRWVRCRSGDASSARATRRRSSAAWPPSRRSPRPGRPRSAPTRRPPRSCATGATRPKPPWPRPRPPWRQGGVELPRTTYTQWNWGAGRRVPLDQLQPGDLLFSKGLGHMGMYAGNGKMVHAPQTGDVIKISTLDDYWRNRLLARSARKVLTRP